jgi:hypothetical protein
MQTMRRLVVAFCLVVVSHCPGALAEGVHLGVFYRTLMIHTPSAGQGTAFTLDVDGKQYLVTAKHMVKGLKPEDTIQLRKYNAAGNLKWVDFRMKIYMCDDPVDIAVLVPHEQLTISGSMEPHSGDLAFGADLYFVGFPFGMAMEFTEASAGVSVTSPFGYVRKATLSAIRSGKTGHVVSTQIILDGYNLGGFSGSPVINTPDANGDPGVIAVISGFKPDYGPALTPKEIRPEETTPEDYGKGRIVEKEGHTYRLEEPKEMKDEHYVLLNTGIAQAWDIRHAVDLIHLHPDGPKVAADFRPSLAP